MRQKKFTGPYFLFVPNLSLLNILVSQHVLLGRILSVYSTKMKRSLNLVVETDLGSIKILFFISCNTLQILFVFLIVFSFDNSSLFGMLSSA